MAKIYLRINLVNIRAPDQGAVANVALARSLVGTCHRTNESPNENASLDRPSVCPSIGVGPGGSRR